ncbi:MAG: cupin domain-containing protein [Gammaproteobacteria bacterium]|nr:cupin domain-containing protein [Gammaproteobacteria bacterium]
MIELHKPSPPEYFFKEGCYILEWYNRDDDEAASLVRARVAAGMKTRWHRLAYTEERYVVVSGQGMAELFLDGRVQSFNLAVGDSLRIPVDVPQRITNEGPEELVFMALCSPRFKAENYYDIEDQFSK